MREYFVFEKNEDALSHFNCKMRTVIIDGNSEICTSLVKRFTFGNECYPSVRVMVLDCKFSHFIPDYFKYYHLKCVDIDTKTMEIILEDNVHHVSYKISFDIYSNDDKTIGEFDTLDESFSDLSKLEIVVAQYKENVSWLYPMFEYCHVYNKGGASIPDNSDIWKWQKLPNIGRESHTYLYHIIQNYNNLANVTVFTQGEIKDHGLTIEDIEEISLIARKNGRDHAKTIIDTYSNWGMIRHRGKWEEELKSGNMSSAKLTFGEFYKEIMGKEHPSSITVYYAAIFAVRSDVIRKHPIEFYVNAIEYVDKHRNPGEGHYFERIWYEMFS